MGSIWLGLSPAQSMRMPNATTEKGHLSLDLSSGRVVTTRIDVIALPVCAALVVDESSTCSCPMMLDRNLFGAFQWMLLRRLVRVRRRAAGRRRHGGGALTSRGPSGTEGTGLERLLAHGGAVRSNLTWSAP